MKNLLSVSWALIMTIAILFNLIDWSLLIYHFDTLNGKWYQHTADLVMFWCVLYVAFQFGRYMEKD